MTRSNDKYSIRPKLLSNAEIRAPRLRRRSLHLIYIMINSFIVLVSSVKTGKSLIHTRQKSDLMRSVSRE